MTEPARTAERERADVSWRKANHVGAPAIFALQTECREIARAFDSYGIYLVGSALERPNWRDVDVRLIMGDADFAAVFPDAAPGGHEFDPRWSLLMVAISGHLSKRTGLPVDFQMQPQTHANTCHDGPRHCLCIDYGQRATTPNEGSSHD
jgi:hypothetical protein